MKVITKRVWTLIDGAFPDADPKQRVDIPPGEYEVERIDNPLGYPNAPFLVLKGTKIGMTEGAWRDWKNGTLNMFDKPIDWGDFEIIVED